MVDTNVLGLGPVATASVEEEVVRLHIVTCSRCPKFRQEFKVEQRAIERARAHNIRHRAWDFRKAVQQGLLSCPCRHHQRGWLEGVCTYCTQLIVPFDPYEEGVTGTEARNYSRCDYPMSEEMLDHAIRKSQEILAKEAS